MIVTQATLQFNLASDVAVDLVDGMAPLHNVESAPPAACEAALALRRGPFLSGFSLQGSSPFEEWLVVTAEQVNHLAGKALTHLANDCVERGDFAQAAAWTRQQLTLEPWNEEVRIQGDYEQAHTAAQDALALSHSFADRISAAYGELTLGQFAVDAGRLTPASEHCRRGLEVAQEAGEHALHVQSLLLRARIERIAGHMLEARRRLEEALATGTQPGVTHTNLLAAVTLGLGHVACAEQDWPQARRRYREALATPGCDAAEA